jgi:uncharacterized membrane protein
MNTKEKDMDRMLVVVFDNEGKAYQGKSALRQLADEASITLYASAVILKHADGSVSVKDEAAAPPLASLGGPAGVLAGASAGLLIGGLVDIDTLRVGEDFVDDVGRALTPNKVALVAEVDEEWTTPVDMRMEALGGSVFRRAQSEVREKLDDEEIAAMKADLAQLKEEIANEHAARKQKLQAKLESLQTKIQARERKLEEQLAARKRLASAKREVLMANAATAGRALKELANTPL